MSDAGSDVLGPWTMRTNIDIMRNGCALTRWTNLLFEPPQSDRDIACFLKNGENEKKKAVACPPATKGR
jgi:hypothetical protein